MDACLFSQRLETLRLRKKSYFTGCFSSPTLHLARAFIYSLQELQPALLRKFKARQSQQLNRCTQPVVETGDSGTQAASNR